MPNAASPYVWFKHQFLPEQDAGLPFTDLGMQGIAITEMLRTFNQQPFALDRHLARLQHGLEVLGWTSEVDLSRLPSVIDELLSHNFQFYPAGAELGVVIFITAGQNPSYLGPQSTLERTLAVHSFLMRDDQWKKARTSGVHLSVPSTKQLPQDCLDPTIKYRSRLHWYIADQQAHALHPGSRALLTDLAGRITETSTGNLFMVHQGTIVTPPSEMVLCGISREITIDLCRQMGLHVEQQPFTLLDLMAADEAFVTSTPYCLLPVASIDHQPLGRDLPGELTTHIWKAWQPLISK